LVERSDSVRQLLRAVDGRLPDSLTVAVVESGEDLAAPAVEDRQRRAVLFGCHLAERNS